MGDAWAIRRRRNFVRRPRAWTTSKASWVISVEHTFRTRDGRARCSPFFKISPGALSGKSWFLSFLAFGPPGSCVSLSFLSLPVASLRSASCVRPLLALRFLRSYFFLIFWAPLLGPWVSPMGQEGVREKLKKSVCWGSDCPRPCCCSPFGWAIVLLASAWGLVSLFFFLPVCPCPWGASLCCFPCCAPLCCSSGPLLP